MNNFKKKAASLIRKTGSELKTTGSRILNKHTPTGVGRAAVGLYKDVKAQKRSEKGLANVRAKAADMLGEVNRRLRVDKLNPGKPPVSAAEYRWMDGRAKASNKK
jgi:hypothetical protein